MEKENNFQENDLQENNELQENSKVLITRDVQTEMKTSFLQYSMAVIVSRALPDVRDGLKPVHRRILYSMYENGLVPEKPYRKCADIVGSVLGSYHPHGDASVYDALVRLSQSFSLRYPLVDGHGNFGSIDGDPPAAYRYTEAKMAKLSTNMLTDINKETVDFMSNYDDRLKEPTVLPSRFPQLLCNGCIGIAVGMATNIPPHNLGEVINAMKLLIDNPDATLDEIMGCIKGPDFPTGGIIMGKAGIRAAYATGRGKITLRSRTSIEEIKGRQCIVVTEIPYMVNKARLVESIANLAKEKRVEGIHFIRDESDRNGLRIVIELKKDAIPQVVLNKLFSYSQLQDTVGVIMLALVNGVPKILTLKDMLMDYIDFQVEIVRRRTEFDLKKANDRCHILKGLVIAQDNIDEVLEIFKTSPNTPESKARLIERFNLSEVQADHIANMTFSKLTGLEKQKLFDELSQLEETVLDLEDILANQQRVYSIILDEVEVIRSKYGDERRTSIENISGEVDIEDLIVQEDNVVTYTNNGYIKRMPVSAYKSQNRGGKGVAGMKQREDDFVDEMFICSTHDNILFISNKGVMYKIKCYEIPEGSKASRGTNIVNLLPINLANGEKLSAMLKTSDFADDKYIVIVTKNGKIKRTPLSSYKNVRKHGLIAIGLDEGDEIAGVRMTDGSNELIVATKNGMALRTAETNIRSMSRQAHGVKVITLKNDDEIVSMARVREGASVMTVTENGFGRKTDLSDYRVQNRGGMGLKNYSVDENKGKVCGIKVVDDEDDLIMISSDGVIIRLRVSDIRPMSRYAKGVKLMRLNPEERVVTFTRAEHDEQQEITEVEQPSEQELEQDRQFAQQQQAMEQDEQDN